MSFLVVIERIYSYQLESNDMKAINFCGISVKFLECTLNFHCSQQKKKLHKSRIRQIIHAEICAYLIA